MRRSTRGALPFEFFESGREPVDALEARDHAAPGGGFLEGYAAGVYAGLGNRMAHHGRAEKHDIIADREMTADGDLTRDLAALADRGAAGDTRQGRDRRMRANVHVVGDHDEVVELHALFDDRVLHRTAIDRGVGADLNIRADAHATHLGHLDPTALLGSESKTAAADDRTRLHDRPGADLYRSAQGDAGDEIDVLGKRDLVLQNAK